MEYVIAKNNSSRKPAGSIIMGNVHQNPCELMNSFRQELKKWWGYELEKSTIGYYNSPNPYYSFSNRSEGLERERFDSNYMLGIFDSISLNDIIFLEHDLYSVFNFQDVFSDYCVCHVPHS